MRRIQDMRKNAGFNIEDRISTWYQAEGELAAVIAAWADYLKAETLTTSLEAGLPPAGAYVEEHTIDTLKLTLGVMQNRNRA